MKEYPASGPHPSHFRQLTNSKFQIPATRRGIQATIHYSMILNINVDEQVTYLTLAVYGNWSLDRNSELLAWRKT